MRYDEYREWLGNFITCDAQNNYVKRCQRVENSLEIDLDDEFNKDMGLSILQKLTYTTSNQYNNEPLKCDIQFRYGSDLRNGMASLKTAVSRYFEFCRKH